MRGPVYAEWRDASFVLDGDAEPPDEFLVQTYGWIVGENALFYSLASEILPDGEVRGVSYIPKAGVIEIVDLEEGDRDRAATTTASDRVRHLPPAGAAH